MDIGFPYLLLFKKPHKQVDSRVGNTFFSLHVGKNPVLTIWHSIRSHRLKTLSHRTPPPWFRCEVQVVGPQVTYNFCSIQQFIKGCGHITAKWRDVQGGLGGSQQSTGASVPVELGCVTLPSVDVFMSLDAFEPPTIRIYWGFAEASSHRNDQLVMSSSGGWSLHLKIPSF